MAKLKVKFINPNTDEVMAKVLTKIIAEALVAKVEREGFEGFEDKIEQSDKILKCS